MGSHIKAYRVHIQYWITITVLVSFFGGLIGTIGVSHLKSAPQLTLLDITAKEQLTHLIQRDESQINSLDHRVTVIEHKLDSAEQHKSKR